ncbi:MAG TPA: translation initiation factor IF-3 [Candidatus Ratteibacteria bacterium]|nr:translation initiation factor IF-3 [bacterium]HRS05442.1 translation initiation factor IF-3 [Candidatus Ratteibacteria bacterium]HON05955.1 translation initiation factor IF-3 [bacterium]HOQ81657.1 translation initiation factor IF-3 [bacterium]HPC28796.1 translation initiation factor IF-3 [bacterium]
MDPRRYNINYRIRAPQVRLISETGQQMGVVPRDEAIAMAKERLMDLVEIVPNANPPVCRILDFKKFLYEQKKKEKEAKKKQKSIQIKEIRLRPEISEHDYNFKKQHIEEFLREGYRVKVSVSFRGREILHKERGYNVLQKLIADLGPLAKIEKSPHEEGRFLNVILIPY